MPQIVTIPTNFAIDLTKNHIAWDQFDDNKIIIAAISNQNSDLDIYLTVGTYDTDAETWSFTPWAMSTLYTPGINKTSAAISVACYSGTDNSKKIVVARTENNNGIFWNNYTIVHDVIQNQINVALTTMSQRVNQTLVVAEPGRRPPAYQFSYKHKGTLTADSYGTDASYTLLTSTVSADTYTQTSDRIGKESSVNGNFLFSHLGKCYNYARDWCVGYMVFSNATSLVTNTALARSYTKSEGYRLYNDNTNDFLSLMTRTPNVIDTNIWKFKATGKGNDIARGGTLERLYVTENAIIGTPISFLSIRSDNNLWLMFTSEGVQASATPVRENYTIKNPLHLYMFEMKSGTLASVPYPANMKYCGRVADAMSPYVGWARMSFALADRSHAFVIGPMTQTDENQTEKLVFGIVDIKLTPET